MAHLPELITRLLAPARYPHPVDQVALEETHGAWVLLAGEWAYKIKKPVDYGFMDFSSLDKRRAACEAELRVNARFATDDPASALYTEVWPILGSAQDPRWGHGEADSTRAIEFAVRMRRFESTQRLDRVVHQGALGAQHISAFARDWVAFQARATVADEHDARSRPEVGLGFARDNLEGLLHAPLPPAVRQQVHRLQHWTESTHSRLLPLLEARRAQGRVREGHGDLHLANLVLIHGRIVPFDAIEFNEDLRWVDVASDLAFLWMDLIAQRQSGLANWLLSEWLDASGDTEATQLWAYFACYRALVRAKVAALRAEQSAHAEPDLAECARYIALAETIATPPPARLIITHGLSGSGKSTAAQHLMCAPDAGPTIRLRSDVERKRLFGLDALARSGSALNGDLYAPGAHVRTYEHLRQRSQALLSQGWTVIVDAAFLKQAERQAFAQLAQALHCPFAILACDAPPAVLRKRIAQRRELGQDPSEATETVLEQQLRGIQPLDPIEREQLLEWPLSSKRLPDQA